MSSMPLLAEWMLGFSYIAVFMYAWKVGAWLYRQATGKLYMTDTPWQEIVLTWLGEPDG